MTSNAVPTPENLRDQSLDEKFSSDLESGPPSPKVGIAQEFNEQTNYVPRRRIITIFCACAAVDMVALIDQTTLAVGLSIIGSALNAGRESSWIATAFFLTSTSFQLLYGRLSDIWSRKHCLLTGLIIFFFGNLGASLSRTAPELITSRAIAGVGGGGLVTVAQIIVSDVVSLRERGKYQGILGAVVAISNGIGPIIGGALVSKSENSWRWIFRLNLPLAVICGILVIFFMPLRGVEGSWKKKLKAVDFLGATLTLACSCLLVLGFTWAGADYPWNSAHVIGAIVAGFGVGILFVLQQWKFSRYPLMPIHIFKQKVVIGAILTMFVNGWNFTVQVYYIPTFYQLAFGYSPVKAGSLLLPLTLIQTLGSTFSGLMVTWTGRYKELIIFGWVLWAIGLGLFSTINEHTGLGKQIGYAMLTGIGVGHTLQPSLIAIQAGVTRPDMAVVTSTRNFIRNLGGTLGLAIAGTILNNYLSSALSTSPLLASRSLSVAQLDAIKDSPMSFIEGDEELRQVVLRGYQAGFRWIFVVGASLAAAACMASAVLLPNVPLDKGDEERLKKEAKERVEEEKKGRREKGDGGAVGMEEQGQK